MRIKDLLVFCLLLFSTNIIAQTKDSKLSIWHKKNIGILDFLLIYNTIFEINRMK